MRLEAVGQRSETVRRSNLSAIVRGLHEGGPASRSELVARTGCRVLLDLTNVAVNAHNHGFEAEPFLRRLPLAAVVQFHLVGYTAADDGSWVDETWTGTGFPKVFYLRYHLYATYFPLWALSLLRRREVEGKAA